MHKRKWSGVDLTVHTAHAWVSTCVGVKPDWNRIHLNPLREVVSIWIEVNPVYYIPSAYALNSMLYKLPLPCVFPLQLTNSIAIHITRMARTSTVTICVRLIDPYYRRIIRTLLAELT